MSRVPMMWYLFIIDMRANILQWIFEPLTVDVDLRSVLCCAVLSIVDIWEKVCCMYLFNPCETTVPWAHVTPFNPSFITHLFL